MKIQVIEKTIYNYSEYGSLHADQYHDFYDFDTIEAAVNKYKFLADFFEEKFREEPRRDSITELKIVIDGKMATRLDFPVLATVFDTYLK